jgi:hypothetical protein
MSGTFRTARLELCGRDLYTIVTRRGNLLSSVETTVGHTPMVPTVYVPPASRFTDRTPAAYPVILRAIRAGIVLTIEWGTLHIMEHVPTWVAVALTVDALLMLGVLESRNWLIFKGRNYFKYSFTTLILAYAAIVAAPTFLPSSTVAVTPPIRQENEPEKEFEARKLTLLEWLQQAQRERAEAKQDASAIEAQKSTLMGWVQQAQRERDNAHQELNQLQKQMQDARLRAPSTIPLPPRKRPVDPQVCAELLRQMASPSPESKKHEWIVTDPDQVKEDVRSVMQNLGCFAPEK